MNSYWNLDNKKRLSLADKLKDKKGMEEKEPQNREHRIKERVSAIKTQASSIRTVQGIAYEKKDSLSYAYATGLLFLINNCDISTDEVILTDIEDLVVLKPVEKIDEDVLHRIKKVCYKLNHDVFDIDASSELIEKNFSIGDLLGLGVWMLSEETKQSADFLNNK